MSYPLLNFVVALHCEAKPIIDFYKLKKISNIILPFDIFINEENTISLVISGVGKISTSTATTFLATWFKTPKYSSFLNYGIAGSSEFNVGTGVLAHKITEESTKKNWYPFINLIKNKTQTELITFDMPQKNYPLKGMIDMEGSAFFQAASYFVSQEHIQVFKIISDHNEATQQKINAALCKELISIQIKEIEQVAHYLFELSNAEKSMYEYPTLLPLFQTKWHFSHAQTLQLKECLRQWVVLFKDLNPFEFCRNEVTAKFVIKNLRMKLNEYANDLH